MLVLLLALAAGAADLEVTTDDRVTLVTVVLHIASSGEFYRAEGDPEYATAVGDWFAPFYDHEAVAKARTLYRRGFRYDAPVNWALHQSPLPELEPLAPLPKKLLARTGTEAELEAFAASLRSFAADSDFAGFVASREASVARSVAALQATSEPLDAVVALEALIGEKAGRYVLIVAPTAGNHHYAVRVGPTFYQVSSSAIGGSETDTAGLEAISLHEFGHSWLNPLVEDQWTHWAPYKALFDPIEVAMRRQAYPSWEITTKEHLVRAVTCHLLGERHGDQVGRACVAVETANGFHYVPVLYQSLAVYQGDRTRWPTLADYGPELAASLAPIAEQGAWIWWEKSPWKAVWTINGALAWGEPRIVVPGLKSKSARKSAAYAEAIAAHFGHPTLSDRKPLRLDGALVVYGTAQSNRLLRDYGDDLPFTVRPDGIDIAGQHFGGRSLRLIAAVPTPVGGSAPWVVYTATSEALVEGINDVFHGPTGWVVCDAEGNVLGSGFLPPPDL